MRFKAVLGPVFQEEKALALRAGVKELADVVFRPAFQAAIDHVAAGRGDEVGADVFGELVGFQPVGFLSVL